MSIDTSTKGSAPAPTVSIADVDKASRAEGQGLGMVSQDAVRETDD